MVMMSQQEPAMVDPIAAVILPRANRTSPGASDGARRAPARVITSPAFAALSVLARVDCEVPLPRLERVVEGKQRLIQLAEQHRRRRLSLVAATVGR
jgi:hypothetical protein